MSLAVGTASLKPSVEAGFVFVVVTAYQSVPPSATPPLTSAVVLPTPTTAAPVGAAVTAAGSFACAVGS